MKKYGKSFESFWSRWVLANQRHLMEHDTSNRRSSTVPQPLSSVFETGLAVFELVTSFAVAMSSSSFRPFRQVATLALLAIISSLTVILKNADDEVQTALRQYKSNVKADVTLSRLRDRKALIEAQLVPLLKSYVLVWLS